jgi:hypothetical protein
MWKLMLFVVIAAIVVFLIIQFYRYITCKEQTCPTCRRLQSKGCDNDFEKVVNVDCESEDNDSESDISE